MMETPSTNLPLDRDDVPTVCVFCSQNCGLRVDVRQDAIVAVRGDEQNPFTNGYTCNKAYRIAHYARHAQRLETPMRRTPDGGYKAVSWEQAIDEIGPKLRQILDENGPHSLAFLGIGGQANHMSMLYALSIVIGTGTQWWFCALAQEKTQRALVDGWMMNAPSDSMLVGHAGESDYVVLMGTNPLISQRGEEPNREILALAKDPNRTLVVVDPRRSETARKAQIHVPLTVGTDVYFLLGLAAIIVREQLYAESFVRDHTTGLETITTALVDVDPMAMATRCGIEASVLVEIARGFAAAERGCIDIDLGVEQSLFNTLTAYLLRLVLALTDNLARPGGAIFVGTFLPRVPHRPSKAPVAPQSGIPGITLMAPVPMFSPNLFAEEVLNDDPGRIRAVIAEGSNPVLTYADAPATRAAFEALELSVVIEPTETETAWVADYVLPTPVGYEKWEFSGFPKPYPLLGMQLRPPVLSAPGETLPEPEIYHRLALSMGLVKPAPGIVRWLGRRVDGPLAQTFFLAVVGLLALLSARSLRRTAPMALFWLYESLGRTLQAPQLSSVWLVCHAVAWTRRADIVRALPELRRKSRPAIAKALFELILERPGGVVLARTDPEAGLDDHLKTPDGRIRLAPQPMMAEIERALADRTEPDPEFPFILNGGMRTHWTANTNGRDPAWRKGAGPHCALRLAPDDAERLGLEKGDRASVRTRVGVVELPVAIDKHVQLGHVHIPNGFGTRYPNPETGELETAGVSINELTSAADRDPFTGCPHHKYVRCAVEVA